MKRTLIFMLAAVMALALAACGRTEKDDKANATDAPGEAAQASAEPTQAPELTEKPEEGAKPFSASDDMAITVNGTVLKVHCDMNDVIALIGTTDNYSESISCTRNGYEKTYRYDGLRVDTLPTDDGDIVGLFVISGEGYTTVRGIGVGASRDEVIKAYGDRFFDDGYYTIYTESADPNNIAEPRIQIVFENDIVTEINVYAPDYSN